ncbi:hypothetical protein PTTG_07749 [Puccinia triticina 1-1 BBBD Race 1]|uniref:Uncharacterized protein n=1 Tax=Puccinia triticina (isolate 1-1 / race 1 (BBBD)) TaxID=630390 RepID=A0A180G3D9_PUCT1|nr:hypothetical protein PTTG_07749 [Puccinia triticina 1-1 BBBD Race 1]
MPPPTRYPTQLPNKIISVLSQPLWDPAEVLQVAYPTGLITLGKSYSSEDVKNLPTITVVPGDATAFKAPNAFKLMLANATPWETQTRRTVVINYAGPGLLLNTNKYRYTWMLFASPTNLSAAGTPPGHWYVNKYVASSGLGDLVAASFFTVKNGHGIFPHNATVVHSNPTANTTDSSGQLGAMPTGASTSTQAAAKSNTNGPLWNDCAAIIKNVVMGLGFAVSGYILVQ